MRYARILCPQEALLSVKNDIANSHDCSGDGHFSLHFPIPYRDHRFLPAQYFIFCNELLYAGDMGILSGIHKVIDVILFHLVFHIFFYKKVPICFIQKLCGRHISLYKIGCLYSLLRFFRGGYDGASSIFKAPCSGDLGYDGNSGSANIFCLLCDHR